MRPIQGLAAKGLRVPASGLRHRRRPAAPSSLVVDPLDGRCHLGVCYVLTLPASLHTSAIDQLRQSGRRTDLSPEVRRELFGLYDAIDRLNRLTDHRETLQFNNVENVHLVVDADAIDAAPGTRVGEDNLPPPIRDRLEALRRTRQAMRGINTSIRRLIASISSPEMRADVDLDSIVDSAGSWPAQPETPTGPGMISTLEAVERESIWSRFVCGRRTRL